MTTKILIVLISILLINCKMDQKDHKTINQIVSDDSLKVFDLKQAYDKKNYQDFFAQFPTTFQHFVNIYGFDDKTGEKPLYKLYLSHINYLFENAEKVDSVVFINKIFEIAKNGTWDADAVGLFQSNLAKNLIKNQDVFLNILSKKTEKELAGFWYFILDGPHPDNKQNRELIENLSGMWGKTNKQIKIIETEFAKVRKAEAE